MIKEYEDAWALGIQYNEAISVYNSEPNILISDRIARVNLCAVLDYFMYISAKNRGTEPAPYDAKKMAELTAPIILVENWKLIQKAREEGVDLEE